MLGQTLESMFLTPRLLGGRIGMHPIAVIFALMAFGHLFGFVGVLIALPVSAVLVVALRRLQALYQSSALYTDGMERVPAPAAFADTAPATGPALATLPVAHAPPGNPPA